MITIETLAATPLASLRAAFNEAFQNYFVPLQLTEESMATKIRSEGIHLPYSIGAFENGQLVGFILHGYDVVAGAPTVYNAGTGVVPSHRGRGLTERMYRFAFDRLQAEGIRHHVLEVIEGNDPAIRVYRKMGFDTVRTLAAFRSTGKIAGRERVTVSQLDRMPDEAASFASMAPAWQNSLASIRRHKEGHCFMGAFVDDELVGVAAFVPQTGRVKQCAVYPLHRRRGIGRTLFCEMQERSTAPALVVTNVDERCTPALDFFAALKFEQFLRLFEMTVVL